MLTERSQYKVSRMDLLLRSKDKEIMYLVLLLQQQISFKEFTSQMQKMISLPEIFPAYIAVIEEIYNSPETYKLVRLNLQFMNVLPSYRLSTVYLPLVSKQFQSMHIIYRQPISCNCSFWRPWPIAKCKPSLP